MAAAKKQKTQRLKKVVNELKTLRWQNFILLFFAGCINAFGVTVFLAPVKLYDSGISGTSILLSQITPEYLTLSVFLLVLNIPLFLFGLKKQGVVFTIYSIFTITVYSLGSWLITDVLPVDVRMASPLAGEDLLLCALFGGMVSGLGSGLTIRYGGAIDGIEVMAVIFAKKLNLTVGSFVMMYNVLLYVVCGFVMNSWILPLYSVVTYAAGLKTVDFVVEGFDRSKSVMIVTDKPQQISDALIDAFACGTTKIAATGGYSNAEKTIIYFVVNRFQIARMRTIIQHIDPRAFVTISEVADVFKSND
ncbi:MAG: YitT family protein [Oscillospiraceae bacterium]|nr:YitT family protein [Oscillospiraceae bacterium]